MFVSHRATRRPSVPCFYWILVPSRKKNKIGVCACVCACALELFLRSTEKAENGYVHPDGFLLSGSPGGAAGALRMDHRSLTF